MGKKLTNVLLFLSFFAFQFIQIETAWGQVGCGANAEVLVGPSNSGANCVCTFDKSKEFTANNVMPINTCPTQAQANEEKAKRAKTEDSGTEKCNQYSTAAEHDVDKTISTNLKAIHCVCNFKGSNGESKEYFLTGTNKTPASDVDSACPHQSPKPAETTAAGSGDEVFACIEDIKKEINDCKETATKTIEICDKNSDKNANIRQPISSAIDKGTQLLHMNAIKKGAAEECRNVSLLSAAAGYGTGKIQGNCATGIASCKSSCSDVIKYDQDAIVAKCKESKKDGSHETQKEQLELQADKLIAVVESVKEECAGSNSTADQILDQTKAALDQFVRSNNAAVQCEQAIVSNTPSTPLTNQCAIYPNSAGCPVNCAIDTGNPQCKCLQHPSDPSCKPGGGNGISSVASLAPNTQVPAIGVSAGGSTFKSGSSGFGNDLNLDLGEASEKSATELAKTEPSKDSGGFQAAPTANSSAGGGGSDGPSAAAKKSGEVTEEKSLIGGTFAALKNAAAGLFGGGNNFSKKAVVEKENAAAKNNIKPVNSALRGVASNGKSCFVDTKGAEFCFGRRNMDIFKMMNSQYSNQYNSLIIDK